MTDEKTVRAKYTPFPRLKEKIAGKKGRRREIDVMALRELYVNGEKFRWVDFCKVHNFRVAGRQEHWFRQHVDWEEWKRAWLRTHTTLQDEDITEELLDVRKLVAVERIKHIRTWTKTAANMHALVQHLMNQHMMDAAWDQQNTLAIQAGTAQKRCKLTIDEGNSFASALQKIEALAKSALLVIQDENKAKQIADESLADERDVIPEFDIIPMGEITNAKERTALLASYFDQFQEPKKELPAPEVKDATQAKS